MTAQPLACPTFRCSGKLKVGLICFTSSYLAEAIEQRGHQVTTVDNVPGSWKRHIQADALEVLGIEEFDFTILCPPCTFLTRAQISLLKRNFPRIRKCINAIRFSQALWMSSAERSVLENPPGLMSRALGPRSDLVQPFMFGDPYRKELCLWLRNVPPLFRTMSSGERKTVANHTNSRMSQDQKMHIKSSWDRFPRMCDQIAEQWFNRV